ncbi:MULTISPECIES: sensor histidine kinase [unclassified Gilvimarinus]|uniref:sensor histidine kinase n=1 Tax=unclassified Gilvimarinus TaxID=2642066 RepID=UPI0026E117AB|nr:MULTISPECIES: sensor histidine kinase [unclassified Gilvimarinus]MDO6572505.1 CHASE3 domain-containing protein [Gilvimarinus sp. 2_MG-2023]
MVVFFLASMGSAYRSISVLHDNNLSISNTLQVLALVQDLKASLVSAETGKRGYLLTADGQYLAPYHKAMEDIDRLLQELSNSNTEIAEQLIRFDKLKILINKKIDRMQEKVHLVHLGQRSEAIEELKNDVGIELMREIDTLIGEMAAEERELLNDNRTVATEDRKIIFSVLMATNVVGLLLAIGIFISVYRHSRKIQLLNYEIEKANNELEEKVANRTFALEQYSDELQRSNRELEEFAFIASHDLQEPLRKIRAFGDRLRQKYKESLDERGADYVERMHAASERMSQLIDDLLSFSRVTTRQEPFKLVDLNEVVAGALEDLEFALEDSGAVVEVGELPEIYADASQLRQVMMNLLSNSIKFRRSGVNPSIAVTCEAVDLGDEYEQLTGQWWRFTFVDNGIGFDEQYADKVFNLFQRLHGRDEYKGTGIGLALCRKIIERHGGTIVAISAPGKGATFQFDLPSKQVNLESLEDVE